MPSKKQLVVGMKLKVTKENSWAKIGSIVEVRQINGVPDGRNTACATGEIYVLVNKSDQKSTYSGFDHGDRKGYYMYLKHLSEIPTPEKKAPEDPHRELKIAFAHGAEIEYFDPHSGKWVSASMPYFHPKRKYRIKPEEETTKHKFIKGDLCFFIGHDRPIPKNSTVVYLRAYGKDDALVQSGLIQIAVPFNELKPCEPEKHKFKEGDLCMFVGTSWTIPKNTIVKYLRPYGDSYAIVESIESKPGFPRGMPQAVKLEGLKPYTPSIKDLVGGIAPNELTVFVGRSSPSASAYFEVEVAKQVAQSCSTQPNPQQEETPMKFENKYFLNGREITDFTDMQIFSIIKDAEDAIEKLEQIATKPKSLQQNIADRKAELAKLVEFLDSREPKTEA